MTKPLESRHLPRRLGQLLGLSLGCALAACSVQAEPEAEAVAVDAPASPGGKADSAFGGPDGDRWAEIMARCTPPAEDEEVLYSNDFHWNYTRDEMAARADEIYVSGKRLAERARFDEASSDLLLPMIDQWGGPVVLSRRLVENVTAHIEIALEKGYADHVFFPDMGHSHYFMPQALWDAEYAGGPLDQISARYARMIDDPELLVLYHTAEQLQMLDENDQVLPDPGIAWRHQTRNVVGDNDGQGRIELLQNPDSKANTARDYADHYYYGAGFNVSASEHGCFPYVHDGELRWYDLSLSDLPYKSDGGSDDWM